MMAFGNRNDDCDTGVAFTRSMNFRKQRSVRGVPYQCEGRGRCCWVSITYDVEMEQKFGSISKFKGECHTLDKHYPI